MATTSMFLLVTCSMFFGLVTAKFDPIAFTAMQSSRATLTSATTIPYDKIVTKHPADTNITKGVFYCTRDGLYKFQVYAGTYASNYRVFLEIYSNSTLVASLYGHNPSDYATAGNVIILQLRAGDTVQVKSKGTYSISLDYSYNTNTFTGVELGSEILYNEEIDINAFSVTATHHQNVPGGSNVQYNNKLIEDGGAFDLSTGVYTVPSAGFYIFHFFSTSRQNEELWQELHKNGNYMCSIYAFTDYDWADAGNTVILHLAERDNITVEARAGLENHLYGTADHIFTTFSGYQIISDNELAVADVEPVIMFSVGLSKNLTVTTKPVVFDHVFVDRKNSYNRHSGYFIAPVTGLYEFNFHALAQPGSSLYLRLIHGRGTVDGVYTHNLNHRSTAGNAAVIEVTGGEKVYIEAIGTNYLVGGPEEIFCTFSGYLLSATGPSAIFG